MINKEVEISVSTLESWSTVREIMDKAHGEMKKKYGISFGSSTLSADELHSQVGDDGVCLGAFFKDNAVGTISISIETKKYRIIKGTSSRIKFLAVDPAYQGNGIGKLLLENAIKWSIDNQYNTILLSTREENKNAISMYQHYGFIPYDYYKVNDYYCILFMRFKDRSSLKVLICRFRYEIYKLRSRLKNKKK